jgi:hypothetical protein
MTTIYSKIPGLGSGRATIQVAVRSRLYRSEDHLLIITSTGFTEEYRRIFYRDIRYVDVRRTRSQVKQGIISAVLTGLLALTYFAYVPGPLVAVFCFPTVLWFVINFVRGEACQCYINTSVQTLRLPTPGRVNKVDTLIAFLRQKTAPVATVETPQPVA